MLASLTLSGRSFHALMVEGRKELKKKICICMNSPDIICVSETVSCTFLYKRR